jgi:hypothetical protein
VLLTKAPVVGLVYPSIAELKLPSAMIAFTPVMVVLLMLAAKAEGMFCKLESMVKFNLAN